ncbi:MAG: prepilin-type N-terminal cleavage/methylation domain-containing protein [Verrucomicrobiota bacterium]
MYRLTTKFTDLQRKSAFTLVELLVATSIMTLMLLGIVQMTNQSAEAIQTSEISTSSSSSVESIFNRIEYDLDRGIYEGGATLLTYDNTLTYEGGFALLTRGRSRYESTTSGIEDDIRGSLVVYSMIPRDKLLTSRQTSPNDSETISLLSRADGCLSFETSNPGSKIFASLPSAFTAMSNDLKKGSDTGIFEWHNMSVNVVAFDTEYILNNGTLTRDPPPYVTINPQDLSEASFLNGQADVGGSIKAIALSPETTNTNYVVGLNITIATLDTDTLDLLADTDQLNLIENSLQNLSATENAYDQWSQDMKDISFLPLRQNLNIAQKTIYLK